MTISKKQFIANLKTNQGLSEKDLARIIAAFDFGAKLHQGQKRPSGNDQFRGHCVVVANHLNHLNMDSDLIIAGLLHNSLENSQADFQLLADNFGDDVAFLVDSISQLGGLKYQYYQRHLASLRKFFLALANDERVIILKLVDRYYNLLSLNYLPAHRQRRLADESLLIHAQIAGRLNMGSLQQKISDLAFAYSDPRANQTTINQRNQRVKDQQKTVESVRRDCLRLLSPSLGYQPRIEHRIKGVYSLYSKIQKKDGNINNVYDLVALRIIVQNPADCYQVLGLIHQHWRPISGRFKDYIAQPKPNGYQSLHTTIFSGRSPVEIQIRTKPMHHQAQHGLAAHYVYKASRSPDSQPKNSDWLHQLSQLAAQGPLKNRDLKTLRHDLFSDRIFVLTPKGDVIDLPQGATVIDFAFAIHSQIGYQARGARIDGRFRALKAELVDGVVVEIITDKNAQPKAAWLRYAKTAGAREKIRAWLNKHQPT